MRPLTGPTEEIEAAQHRTPAPRSRLHRRAGCRQTPLLLGCGRAPSSGITHFEQLRGRTWVYNDARSLSGWHCALERLRTMRSESEVFSSTVPRAHITNPFDWSMKGSSTPPPSIPRCSPSSDICALRPQVDSASSNRGGRGRYNQWWCVRRWRRPLKQPSLRRWPNFTARRRWTQ